MNSFLFEIKNFSKNYYFIYVISLLTIIQLLLTKWFISSLEVIIILIFHLIADILMTIMVKKFWENKFLEWFYYQLYWTIIFTIIWIYSYIFHNDIIYLLPNLIYTPVVLKNIYEIKTNKKINFLNKYTILFLAIFIYLFVLIRYNLLNNISMLIQFTWVLFFAVVLNYNNKKILNYWWILCLLLMIFWWFLKLYNEIFFLWVINWATFSFTILPSVVLLWFLKNLKNN